MSGTADDIHEFPAAGIKERIGRVNRWLYVVYVGLGGWAAFYLITHLAQELP